ncbi:MULTISPECIES: DUF2812 domain-containing protein [unclassified Ruminococcus]|uniref:DUF2812 domain-containing protein n=1 Tax=unclassified Ruminococcus TaxID=2608920 RepID=UPI00210E3400|nr:MULTISPECIES: DUF2812 domain-containing protein [unclassified Ruminococcus]MCQ4022919.1 DUF2812 domain-containing protein [Ruminococcus sp. zg-924]MCQ4115265.1 DUF2812 domain-containing protein [Ruminococcus sp. zg-921]
MKTKKQFKWFTIFEYEKEQDYLREMHKAGWKFIKVKFGIYYFEKCTPQDVVYQLDYNEDGLKYKDEYLKMFDDCGWEYIQDYIGYSYFRKAVAAVDGVAEEIFCDEESRLQMMQRALKGRMLPLLVIFFATLLPLFLINLLSTHNYVITSIIGGILVWYIVIFAMCFVKYNQYKNKK